MEASAHPRPDVIYRVDRQDRIVACGGDWDRFARENGAAALVGEAVVGVSLWGFVEGVETRHLHQTLLARVRETGEALHLPFRCDAPDERRDMAMDMVPLADDGVEYRCRVMARQMRPPVPVAGGAGVDGPMLRMCSWCKRIDAGKDEWCEPEEAVARLGLLDTSAPPLITHTICDACMQRLGVGEA